MGLENPLHILIILAVVLLLFGAKRLPEMGKGLGSGIRGFKDGLNNLTESDEPATPTVPAPEQLVAAPAAAVAAAQADETPVAAETVVTPAA